MADETMASVRFHGADGGVEDTSGDRGRSVMLTTIQAAHPGALVFKAPVFAKILEPSLWATHCHHCFRAKHDAVTAETTGLSRCGRCRAVYYCSRACQQQDWRPDHQLECTRLPQLTTLRLRSDQIADILLLGRVFRRLESSEKGSESPSPLDFVWNQADLCQETELLSMLASKLGLVDAKWPLDAIQKMLSRFQNNNYSICDAKFLPLGSGCFPLGAMVNHSCAPNTVATFRRDSLAMEFRALRVIEPGEEITHSYVDPIVPRTQRQARLRGRYHFDCQCQRCVGSENDAEGRRDQYLDADVDGIPQSRWPAKRQEALQEAESKSEDPEAWDTLNRRIETLRGILNVQQRHLHSENTQLLGTLSQLFEAQLEDEATRSDALIMGEKILHVYERVYPENHPMIGLQRFTLGDLCITLSRLASAKTYFSDAYRILQITHGRKHELVELLRRRLGQ
ncbi:hypothetical protein Poli38472_013981 [Pythium oligandrum]|uniref:MYND-type zinc finger protein samB n=1 Tax=Pythium oligandrum TaxID=41045 RepID=A0A8K1CND5_PYTOL|nr:hypothetical protein Poli38472_013981 [Pythium oligandrum]|eukprot:TMW66669.1 hypothetical protein Poli38472_013981 [Pythium oligandrum]